MSPRRPPRAFVDTLCRFAEGFLNDFLPFAFVVTVCFAIIFGGFAAGYAYFSPRECAAQWADYEHRWSFHRGCQIKIDSRWVPTGNVKVELRRIPTHPIQAN